MCKVELIWFNAGGGHRAAADALQQALHTQGWPGTVHKVNLTEVLDPHSLFMRCTGMAPEDLYNKRLASGFTLGLKQELKLLQALIRASHGSLVSRLARHWSTTQPDLVVSLIPNFNRALHDALLQARPGVPLVTVLTDMADHPPHFWIEPDTTQHVVCGTAHAEAQALAAGCPRQRVHRVSGMLLRPGFYLQAPLDRSAERQELGLDPQAHTGLVLFGGTGSRVMKRIAQRLPDTPLILMCGRNEELADALRAQPSRAPRVVVGYTRDVARWMQLADFFIGKPGPGSLSEAVQQGLPVIVTRNSWTLPQEGWNTTWVQQQGLGIVMRHHGQVAEAVHTIVADLTRYRERVRQVENRAIFEVPELLRRILKASRPAQTEALASSF